jgi:hypothetical protein
VQPHPAHIHIYQCTPYLNWLCDEDGHDDGDQEGGQPLLTLDVLEHDAVEQDESRRYQHRYTQHPANDHELPRQVPLSLSFLLFLLLQSGFVR